MWYDVPFKLQFYDDIVSDKVSPNHMFITDYVN